MTDLFNDEEALIEDTFNSCDKEDVLDIVDIGEAEGAVLDARRKLERILEEKRLREELDDFVDLN